MRTVNVRELALGAALVAVLVGWAWDRNRLAVEREQRGAAGSLKTTELAERIVSAEALAEDLARRLEECEGRE